MKKTTIIVTLLLLVFTGCSYTPPKPQKVKIATQHRVGKSLNYLFKEDPAKYAPKSGFYSLSRNTDGYTARALLIQNAKHTLDLQYYLYIPDSIGLSLTKMLLDAADRGVKVRLLLDDMLMGSHDGGLAALASHPNISIKLFNPTSLRSMMHYLQIGLHVDTLGRRMHNKAFIADDNVAILGGRNIQTLYFSADTDNIFIDDEVMAVGPLAAEVGNEFETYWNSPVVKPISKIKATFDISLKKLKKKIDDYLASSDYKEYLAWTKKTPFYKEAQAHAIPLIFGNAKLFYDLPTKVITSENDNATHLSKNTIPYILNAKQSLYIISPYFIPNKATMEVFKKLRKNGVKIMLVTNSLATNDGIPVYAAYKNWQKELLKTGVELYEISPYAFHYLFKKGTYKKNKIPRTSLHAKTMIIDNKIVMIGSSNLDPRSLKLNTEVVAVIKSKKLAQIKLSELKESLNLHNVYKLSLEPAPPRKQIVTYIPQQEKERVVWTTIIDGKKVKLYNDADAGFWRRLGSNLSRYLPIEGYL